MTREEAINEIKSWAIPSKKGREVLETLIPELRESEDERHRKWILEYLYDGLRKADEQFKGQFNAAIAYLEKQKEQKPIIQDVELNDAVYDYVRDHFIAGADFTPEYIKKLMENAFFAGVDYYLLKQESESCEPDTNVEKVIEDVIRVYGKTQGKWVGGYDVDTLIVNLRRAFNKKEQKPADDEAKAIAYREYERGRESGLRDGQKYVLDNAESYGLCKPAEWSEEDERILKGIIGLIDHDQHYGVSNNEMISWLKDRRPSKDCSSCAKHLEGYISGRSAAENKLLEQFGALITPEDELHIKPRWKPSEEQILAIVEALKYLPNNKDEWMILNTLIDFLKKLM